MAGRVYRPAFGASPLEAGAQPFEIVNEGADTGEDTGADASAASAVLDETGSGGVMVSPATEPGDAAVEAEAPAVTAPAPTAAPTETKEALKAALAKANAEAKKWKRRFIVATVVGSITTVGGSVASFFIGKGRKAKLSGMSDGMSEDGLDELEDAFDEPPKKRGRR